MDYTNDKNDEETCADNLSNYSCNSDIEIYTDDDSETNEEVIPHSLRIHQQTISSDSDISSDENEEWSSVDNPPDLEAFLGSPGINVKSVPHSIMDAVNLFIGEDFFIYLIEESNRYYDQNKNKFKLHKKSLKWKDITVQEMKKFLGLILFMGQIHKDKRDDYWTTDVYTETPFFAKTMSRDRFRYIWRAWHFNNNENLEVGSDRLYKVRPVINYFLPKFINIYKPIQQLSLDEGIIPWRGKLFLKTYNANKIIKYGILMRMVCESNTGYICNFEIYSAQNQKLLKNIKNIIIPFTDLWHHLYLNNYYNSVENSEILFQNKIRICGTICKNRGLPDCLKYIKLKRGESIFRRKKQVLLQLWQSKRVVSLISTIHSAKMQESHEIDRKTREKIIKPNALIDYNKYMKGVDRVDLYLSYYNILQKTTKWTKRVVMYLINCALFNSFVVLNSVNKKKIKYKYFLKDVAMHWVTDEVLFEDINNVESLPSTSNIRRTPKVDPPGRLSMDMRKHILEKILGTGKKQYAQRRCRVCVVNKRRGETCFMCKFCGVPLHRGQCFEKYHTLKQY